MRHDLRMLQWPEEVEAFDRWLVTAGVATVLEIGTGPGGFIQHIGRLLPEAKLVTVDLPASGDATGLSQAASVARNKILSAEFGGRISCVLGDSHLPETVAQVGEALNRGWLQVDLLFLDGDDSYDGKVTDLQLYSRFLAPGAWRATHDINAKNTGVPAFWSQVKDAIGPHIEISGGHHWGGIGIW